MRHRGSADGRFKDQRSAFKDAGLAATDAAALLSLPDQASVARRSYVPRGVDIPAAAPALCTGIGAAGPRVDGCANGVGIGTIAGAESRPCLAGSGVHEGIGA